MRSARARGLLKELHTTGHNKFEEGYSVYKLKRTLLYLKRTTGTQIGMFFSTAWKHRSTVNNNAILLGAKDFKEHEKIHRLSRWKIHISDQYRRESWNKSNNQRRGSDQHSVTALHKREVSATTTATPRKVQLENKSFAQSTETTAILPPCKCTHSTTLPM